MDPLQLLANLEQLRDKIPAELSADFESLIASIRNIYENTIKLITPPIPVEDGQQRLAAHYANIDALQLQLHNRLPAFQEVYVGDGSNSYHMTATTSLQNVQSIRDHLATASQLHGTMALNFGQATQAQIALDALLVGLGITLAVLIASAGSTAPATVPAALLEAASGAVTIGIMTEAEAAATAAVLGLMWASLPEALVIGSIGALGTDIALNAANIHLPISAASGFHRTSTDNTGVITHQINLTKYPKLDPKQQEAANELVREFNNPALEKWIEYLMHVLGLKNVSPEDAKQIIRCLHTKGYLDIRERMKSEGLDPNSRDNAELTNKFKKAWNAIMDQLNPRTLQGAWAENNGIDTTIPELGPKDHITKTDNGLEAIKNCIDSLNTKIADYRTPPGLRSFYQAIKKSLENTRDVADRLSNGNRSQGPSTWEDPKGEVPFGKDIIETSGCLPA